MIAVDVFRGSGSMIGISEPFLVEIPRREATRPTEIRGADYRPAWATKQNQAKTDFQVVRTGLGKRRYVPRA